MVKNQGEVRIYESQFKTQEDSNYKLQINHSGFSLLVGSEHQNKSRFINQVF